MAGKWNGYFKIITPQVSATKMTDSQEMADVGAYNNYTWYQRLIQGSASRMTRYREYDLMDNDIEVARALDTIAEEMTGNNPKTKEPLLLDILTEDEDNVESIAVLTLKAALRRWGYMYDFPNRLYRIARLMIKYGDVFFRRGDKIGSKWEFIHPKNVIAAVVSEHDVTKVIAWQIKNDIQKPRTGGYGMPIGAKQDTQMETEIISSDEIIRFTLNDDMNDTQPFGESVLRTVYRSHKQKELLEDAVIIYRIQRAPERRAFYIDVGKMPPARVKQYLEGIKNEIKQKKIPTLNGGQQEVDSVYNPHSMCLALDTKIPLLDGRTLMLSEMITEHEKGKENWVYSINPETGEVVPGIVSWAGITQKNAETIKLILDNGEEIVCTPEHKFPIQGKGKVEAKDITPEDSLFPFNKNLIDVDDLSESTNLNHRVVKIEKGEVQNVGTLTIDKEERYHNYHTFALSHCFIYNSEDFYFACLSMKTKVFLLDGRTLSIDELREEYEQGKENWTYSVDQKTGKLIHGKIDWAGYTRRNAEIMRVYLDNNETIDVTPDHKFVLKDGSEVEAQNLTTEMNLMSVHVEVLKTKVSNISKVELLPYREDTGCLHVIDDDNNHNFALTAGVYVKNSRPDGRGSRVETLPGGQGLGELTDLEYFQRKVWRGLKVPVSYMTEQSEGGQIWNDGKVGIAYIQELRFSLYIERLQNYIEKELDKEFKKFLRSCNITIEESMYRILLPEPSNFGKYRQLELDSQLLSSYTTAEGIPYLSPRFTMKRYLQMSDEEIIVNERLKREELGIDPDSKDPTDLQKIYAPAEEGLGGGGLGGGGLGGGFGGAELGMGEEPAPEGGAGTPEANDNS